ncbi:MULTISPECIES: phosphoenolpyruvate mutase [unclassified Sphingomonas]|uniref:phosphoenolpyruvate mutase n=1 Tax=unclassified Sphingomonas TaxID=196159 RepID=UPI00226A9ABC|nr:MULTISPECIES: phosphoenolpyruvate mutase [unclassified Sphingomonas]
MNDQPTSFATPTPGLSRATLLRNAIEGAELAFLMEAHSGLSAKIVEEAGFGGIWASGLSISASLGLRDSNEASWTQVLDVLEYMSDATTLPILVDGDTGYGNFNNVRRLVRKLGERNIAGVCIEDKLFPKTNSFIGEEQPLADIGEFCGRITAGKDSQTSDDFVIVARVEALISSRPMEEALRRAEAYHAAGADAILIHSKKADGKEIFEFCRRWGNRAPVVIVPTTYYPIPTDQFREANISTVIWANHLMRASITAMRETAKTIHAEQSLMNIEGRVIPVKEVFRLMGNAELEEAEKRYLPETPRPRAVVLAASGGDLGELTRDRPKCMIDVRGQSLLARQVATFADTGIRDVTVVRGFAKDAVALKGIKTVDNDRFAETGEVFSLAQAADVLSGEVVVSYGDVLFRNYILESLLSSKADIVLAVDATPREGKAVRDLVLADHAFSGSYLDEAPAHLTRMGSDLGAAVSGEWVGLARFSAAGAGWLRDEIAALDAEGLLETADLPLLLSRIAAKHPVRVKYFTGHWMDVNTLADVADARNFT